jgi:hypothetical protein
VRWRVHESRGRWRCEVHIPRRHVLPHCGMDGSGTTRRRPALGEEMLARQCDEMSRSSHLRAARASVAIVHSRRCQVEGR